MKHLGDITKISGYDAPLVDVIIGGSPCQDLSIAGKRAGFCGARSGLFMEQIRIIKEMREKDAGTGRTADLLRPRYMVWENVPGAFSANKGEDFRIVLEETAKIAEPSAVIPRPPKGKWTTAGCIMGDGWSIAWRVLDAQFWGVPQRRRRIALVADFGGQSAPEILFERESVSGDFAESGAARERTSGDTENGIDTPVRSVTLKIRSGCDGGGKGALIQIEKSATLSTHNDQTVFCLQGNGIDRADTAECNGRGWKEDISYTLNTVDRPAVAYGFNGHKSDKADIQYGDEKCPCIEANMPPDVLTYVSDEVNVTSPINASVPKINGPVHTLSATNAARTLATILDARGNGDGSTAPTITGDHERRVTDYTAVVCRTAFHKQKSDAYCEIDIAGTCTAHDGKESSDLVIEQSIVRRLTPLECERLQGYPDGWTDIGDWTDSKGKRRTTSDSARYKALGNSIALPPWLWVLSRLNTYCAEKTMASLFDGIGGFPLIWETLNGKGYAVWCSEIEEFPIAVTKMRFPE